MLIGTISNHHKIFEKITFMRTTSSQSEVSQQLPFLFVIHYYRTGMRHVLNLDGKLQHTIMYFM